MESKMGIVPAGKIRIMKAQSIGNASLYGVNNDVAPSSDTTGLDMGGSMPSRETGRDIVPQDITEDISTEKPESKNTLSNFIFDKLKSFGYPGRRLEEFKKKFVREDISADGIKNVSVEIPDKHYPSMETGAVETIEADDLRHIIREISQKFSLNFNGADRSDGRWTMKFTSADVHTGEDENELVRDNLDEVYGTPSKSKKKKERSVRASTIQELIQGSKEDIIGKLKKIIGENNGL